MKYNERLIKKMKTKFFNILRNEFNFAEISKLKNPKILVGVSGGADSIFLLHFLNLAKNIFNFELIAVHINHKLRGEESEKDASFVEDFCKNLGVNYIVKNIKINSKNGIEEKARLERYKIFLDICKKYDIKYCALAHNADDNIETILMWLIRGTGLSGAEGIPKARFLDEEKKIVLIRPILEFFKKEILGFLDKNQIPFRIDKTNESNVFVRNKIRNQLVPLLEKYNSKVKNHILNFSKIIAENNSFVDEILQCYLNDVCKISDDNIVIDLEKYIGYNVAIQKKILAHILKNKANSAHVKALFELLKKNKNFVLPLKSKFLARKEYKYLTIKKVENLVNSDSLDNFDFAKLNKSLVEKKSGAFESFRFEIEIFDIKNPSEIKNIKDKNSAFLDYDLVQNKNLVFRIRKRGDIFKPFGMKNFKKLKEFFIDEKIPARQRDEIVLLAEKNEIFWVSGYRICEDFKVSGKTKKVLRILIEKIILR